MVSQLMARGNEVAQVREELLQKMLAFDTKMEEIRAQGAVASERLGSFETRINKV
eukprot:COSAG02_NODE_43619_length_373_cov_0.748175_2_plen_54_part_01